MEQAVEEQVAAAQSSRAAGRQMLWGQSQHPEITSVEGLHSRYLRFLAWMMVVPVILYLVAIPLVRSNSYLRWSPNLWTPRLDYAFNTANRNADVLIFGDSSAFLGIDPKLLNAELGVKSFVIPGTIGSLPYTGDFALKQYLAINKPPRVLVLYFSAWDMDYLHTPNFHTYEGVEMLVRHGTWAQIADFARRHPRLALTFPVRMYGMVMEKTKPYNIRKAHENLPDDSGHFDYTEPFDPEQPGCRMPEIPVLSQTAQTTVQDLARRYSPIMQVVVYVAPIPACVNNQGIVTRSYASVGAAPPAVLPVQAFFGDTGFAHIEPQYLGLSSRLLAVRLRQPLDQVGLEKTSSYGLIAGRR